MEQNGQSEFAFVRRSTGIPLNRAQLVPVETEAGAPSEPENPVETEVTRFRWSLPEGEPRFLLIQITAGVLLFLAVALGLWLGGAFFRNGYVQLTTRNSVDIPGFFEPLAGQEISSDAPENRSSYAPEESVSPAGDNGQ